MILSVSRRTDIPAFYSEWFYNRIKDGYFLIRNPMNAHQVSRVNIRPDVVDCMVFWTKNPKPMLNGLDELSDYKYYFQFTITGYGKEIEPHVPELSEVIESFQTLSDKLGPNRVIWRYDPIIFTKDMTPEYHLSKFREIAESLYGYTNKCVISFVDIYPTKNKSNMKELSSVDISEDELNQFAKNLSAIASENGMKVATCAEKIDLSFCGIEHNSCIDRELIESIVGYPLKVNRDGQRGECLCVKCEEMGTYNTCVHGCKYCYANYNDIMVKEMAARYDVSSPMLCDSVNERTDKITNRPVKSLRDKKKMTGQLSMF